MNFNGTSRADRVTGTSSADRMLGLDGNDLLMGAAGNDELIGGNGLDTLMGGAGEDTLSGDAGNDSLDGGTGNDSMQAGIGTDTLIGGAGNDTLDGGDGTDTLSFTGARNDYSVTLRANGTTTISDSRGIDGTDTFTNVESFKFGSTTVALADMLATANREIIGTAGDDNLAGNVGNDTITGAAGNDTLAGGTGNDTAAFSGARADYTVKVDAAGVTTITDNRSIDGTDAFNGIESFQFSDTTAALADVMATANREIVGTAAADGLAGGLGNDTITGAAGDDTLAGGSGTDTAVFSGQNSDYTVTAYANGATTITDNRGIEGTDTFSSIESFQFSDSTATLASMLAGANRQLVGNHHADNLVGGVGNDTLTGAGANDTLSGGAGTDTAVFSGARSDYTAKINAAGVTTIADGRGIDGTDTFNGIESFQFSDTTAALADIMATANREIIGSAAADTMSGGAGNDTISGGAGNDRLSGLDGDDTINGQADNDVLIGGNGNDTLLGGDGSDSLHGDTGADVFYGGSGNDWIYIGAGDVIADGGAGSDHVFMSFGADLSVTSLVSIESINGTWGDDNIDLGSYSSGFQIYLGGGNDIIRGSQGNDTIDGAGGNAILRFSGARADYDAQANGSYIDIADLRGAGGDGVDRVKDITVFRFTDGDFTAVQLLSDGPNTMVGTSGDDTLDGAGGNDFIDGAAGNDQLIGGSGDDHLLGHLGDDTLTGGAGNDTIDGQYGSDTAVYSGNRADYDIQFFNHGYGQSGFTISDTRQSGDGIDTLTGVETFVFADGSFAAVDMQAIYGTEGGDYLLGLTDQVNTIDGRGGNDNIVGGSADDTLIGGDGDDTVDGNNGNDLLTGGAGNDTIDGGGSEYQPDNDTVVFSGNRADYDVYVDNGYGSSPTYHIYDKRPGGGDGIDRVTNVENFVFADGSFTTADITHIYGTEGDDALYGSSEHDTINGRGGNDGIQASNGDDTIGGGDGNDSIDGGDGSDVMTGGAGDDFIYGGYDYSYGNSYEDTVVFSGNRADYVVEMQQSYYGGPAEYRISDTRTNGDGQDYVSLVENFVFADGTYTAANVTHIYGTAGDDNIYGGYGSDTIDGVGGSDSIMGAEGEDVLIGGAGDDLIDGGAAADVLTGGAGNDYLHGGNSYYGYDSGDTAVFSGNRADYLVETQSSYYGDPTFLITDTRAEGDGQDQVTAVEYFMFADGAFDAYSVSFLSGSPSNGDDTIVGQSIGDQIAGHDGNDTIQGGGGADTIDGGQGDDVLVGGAGEDTMFGGVGSDTFLTDLAALQTGGAFDVDHIGDYEAGIDHIAFQGLTAADVQVTDDGYGSAVLNINYEGSDRAIVVHNVTAQQINDDGLMFI